MQYLAMMYKGHVSSYSEQAIVRVMKKNKEVYMMQISLACNWLNDNSYQSRMSILIRKLANQTIYITCNAPLGILMLNIGEINVTKKHNWLLFIVVHKILLNTVTHINLIKDTLPVVSVMFWPTCLL